MSESRSAQVLPTRQSRTSHDSHGANALHRYDVQEQLARGGMGAVYRAHDRLLDRRVALKRLTFPREQALRARLTTLFQNEYETLAQLSHPRIVEVYEYGIDAEGPYYTMELLSGGDLSKVAPLPFKEAARLLRDVASALALVHARRYLHRDLSPANVRLTADGRAKLIDFGALASFGVPSAIVGTPAFVAPECLTRAALDQRTDLYALGALAYWCVTGRQAVRAASMAELPAALERPLVMPSEYALDLPKGMEELIVSLLNHDPLARPSSAAEVMDRLTAIANLAPEEQQVRVAESYLAYPQLVGRAEQIAQFGQALVDACAGKGSALWVEASHGLGRSALLDCYARKAQLSGAALVRSSAHAQTAAFAVLRGLTRSALAIEPSLLATHPEVGQFAASGEQQNQVRSAAEAIELTGKLLTAIERFVLDFAAHSPLVVLVDDVQRADPESLGLLAALAHRAPEHALLLVLSSAAAEPLADAHAHARLVEDAQPLSLSPFALPDIVELCTTLFGPVPNIQRLALWLSQNGAENPLRCLTLLRLLLAREELQYVSGTFSLPYDVSIELCEDELEEATLARAFELGPVAQHAARLLAAYELPVGLSELYETSEGPSRELLVALGELSVLGIVRCVDERYAFAHASAREAVVRLTGPEVMRSLHLSIGRMMITRPDATLDVRCRGAYHLLHGGAEAEGIRILTQASPALARSHESLAKAVPALELAVKISARLGRSDAGHAALLLPLGLAGYYRDPRLCAPYFRRTLDAYLELSGVKLAARMQRFLGGKLGLIAALLVARLRYARVRKQSGSPRNFKDLFTALFAIAGTGLSAACSSFDFQLAFDIGEALRPFAALGPLHPANVMREFCVAVAEGRRASQRIAEEKLGRLAAMLEKPGQLPKLDEEVRVQVLVGVLYALGMIRILRSGEALSLADAMDREQRGFFAPHAELLRMLHHALRGDQQAAEPHRERTERLALLGGSGWSAVNNTAHRALLVYQWTEDSMALLRVITDLKRFAPINPAVVPHIELAEAYLELLRGRPELAVERYERLLALPAVQKTWTYVGERGRYAEALNAVGRFEKAREICQETLASLEPGERAYAFLSQVCEQQLALAQAQLGDHAGAAARLDALLAAAAGTNNPLLVGTLHRHRAQVAVIAGDHLGYEQHLRGMVRLYRATQNPALIRQCERLYSSGVKRGFTPVPSADDPFPLSSLSGIAFHSVAKLPENDLCEHTEIVSDPADALDGSAARR